MGTDKILAMSLFQPFLDQDVAIRFVRFVHMSAMPGPVRPTAGRRVCSERYPIALLASGEDVMNASCV